MSIWTWADWLPEVPPHARVTLGEGATPLVRSRRIGPALGLKDLWFKLESSGTTGSYKDRFAAVGISRMVAAGKRRCIATSSGNTGSALAAYSAAAGIACLVVVVEGAPAGKLEQMMVYGARLRVVRGFGRDPAITAGVMDMLEELNGGGSGDSQLLISAYRYSAEAMSGVETISFELAEQASADGAAVDAVYSPAGGGGLTLAVARGFERLVREGTIARCPAIHCVQPEGNDTIAGPLAAGAHEGRAVTCTSAISGVQVPTVIDGDEVIAACRRSGGTGYLVPDETVWHFQRRLAEEEGIFCEPAGALALAGLARAAERGKVDPHARSVCLVTGSGFKVPEAVSRILDGRAAETVELAELRRTLAGA